MRNRPRPKRLQTEEKVPKIVTRRTALGEVNAAIDALDSMTSNRLLDTTLHLTAETALGKGTLDRRVKHSVRKTVKY